MWPHMATWFAKGPGFWKLNCSPLNDKQYVDEINCLPPSWLQEGKREFTNPHFVWDWVKSNVKKYFRQYSMTRSQQRKAEEWQFSGVITVDPFEILGGEKKVYENLHKSRRNCLHSALKL